MKFRSYGYEFEDSRKRVGRLEEAADLIGRLWREPEVDFEGNYYRIDNCIKAQS